MIRRGTTWKGISCDLSQEIIVTLHRERLHRYIVLKEGTMLNIVYWLCADNIKKCLWEEDYQVISHNQHFIRPRNLIINILLDQGKLVRHVMLD